MTNRAESTPNDVYKEKALRFLDKGDHYELIHMDDFALPSVPSPLMGNHNSQPLPDVLLDLKNADKSKELHIFVLSHGGFVASLNALMQQVREFDYVVGVNLGTACSCGFMLLACANELYTSPYCEFMYHVMSGGAFGKVAEMSNQSQFCRKWWDALCANTTVNQILTPDEMKLGETTEVWLTGAELIKRGVARDYSEYVNRCTPMPCRTFYEVDGVVYRKVSPNVCVKYTPDNKDKYHWGSVLVGNPQTLTVSKPKSKAKKGKTK